VGVVGLAFKANTDDLRESPMVTLVENLIGKGLTVRVFDPNVRLASLVGANRLYIEMEIPHIASLMCEDPQTLAEESDVIVIGTRGEDAERVLAACREGQTVIDLTRSSLKAPEFALAEVSA